MQKISMDRKNITLKDAIVFFKGVIDPYIGAVTLTSSKIVIQVGTRTTFVPLDALKMMLFKGNATSFGICANGAIYSSENYDYWNKETSKIAKRELESCGIYAN